MTEPLTAQSEALQLARAALFAYVYPFVANSVSALGKDWVEATTHVRDLTLAIEAAAAERATAPLVDALRPLLQARHDSVHNGDIVKMGRIEDCALCEPVYAILARHAAGGGE